MLVWEILGLCVCLELDNCVVCWVAGWRCCWYCCHRSPTSMCVWNWTTVWSVDWLADSVTDAGVRDPRPLCVFGTGWLCGLLTGWCCCWYCCHGSPTSMCVWNWTTVWSVDQLSDTVAASTVTDSTDCLQVMCCVVMCCAVDVEADSELTDCLQVMWCDVCSVSADDYCLVCWLTLVLMLVWQISVHSVCLELDDCVVCWLAGWRCCWYCCHRSSTSVCVWNWMSVWSVDRLAHTVAASTVTDSTDCLQVMWCDVCSVSADDYCLVCWLTLVLMLLWQMFGYCVCLELNNCVVCWLAGWPCCWCCGDRSSATVCVRNWMSVVCEAIWTAILATAWLLVYIWALTLRDRLSLR